MPAPNPEEFFRMMQNMMKMTNMAANQQPKIRQAEPELSTLNPTQMNYLKQLGALNGPGQNLGSSGQNFQGAVNRFNSGGIGGARDDPFGLPAQQNRPLGGVYYGGRTGAGNLDPRLQSQGYKGYGDPRSSSYQQASNQHLKSQKDLGVIGNRYGGFGASEPREQSLSSDLDFSMDQNYPKIAESGMRLQIGVASKTPRTGLTDRPEPRGGGSRRHLEGSNNPGMTFGMGVPFRESAATNLGRDTFLSQGFSQQEESILLRASSKMIPFDEGDGGGLPPNNSDFLQNSKGSGGGGLRDYFAVDDEKGDENNSFEAIERKLNRFGRKEPQEESDGHIKPEELEDPFKSDFRDSSIIDKATKDVYMEKSLAVEESLVIEEKDHREKKIQKIASKRNLKQRPEEPSKEDLDQREDEPEIQPDNTYQTEHERQIIKPKKYSNFEELLEANLKKQESGGMHSAYDPGQGSGFGGATTAKKPKKPFLKRGSRKFLSNAKVRSKTLTKPRKSVRDKSRAKIPDPAKVGKLGSLPKIVDKKDKSEDDHVFERKESPKRMEKKSSIYNIDSENDDLKIDPRSSRKAKRGALKHSEFGRAIEDGFSDLQKSEKSEKSEEEVDHIDDPFGGFEHEYNPNAYLRESQVMNLSRKSSRKTQNPKNREKINKKQKSDNLMKDDQLFDIDAMIESQMPTFGINPEKKAQNSRKIKNSSDRENSDKEPETKQETYIFDDDNEWNYPDSNLDPNPEGSPRNEEKPKKKKSSILKNYFNTDKPSHPKKRQEAIKKSPQPTPVDQNQKFDSVLNEKITVLNSQIKQLKMENERVKKLRKAQDKVLKGLNEEKEKFEETKKIEMAKMKKKYEAEIKEVRKQMRSSEQRKQALSKIPDKAQREEIEMLKKELEQVKMSSRAKVKRLKNVIERQDREIKTLEKENGDLKDEVKLYEQMRLQSTSKASKKGPGRLGGRKSSRRLTQNTKTNSGKFEEFGGAFKPKMASKRAKREGKGQETGLGFGDDSLFSEPDSSIGVSNQRNNGSIKATYTFNTGKHVSLEVSARGPRKSGNEDFDALLDRASTKFPGLKDDRDQNEAASSVNKLKDRLRSKMNKIKKEEDEHFGWGESEPESEEDDQEHSMSQEEDVYDEKKTKFTQEPNFDQKMTDERPGLSSGITERSMRKNNSDESLEEVIEGDDSLFKLKGVKPEEYEYSNNNYYKRYLVESKFPKTVVNETVLKNGKIEKLYSDGKTEIVGKNAIKEVSRARERPDKAFNS